MKKVNISLVGGQPMPVYVGIEATKPDVIILVHSSKSKKEAETIKIASGLPSALMELPAVDYPKIIQLADALLNSYNDHEVFVNISSGTKLWSVAFAQLSVGLENVTVIYVDQNSLIHDLTHKETKEVVLPMSIDTILRYHNQQDYTHEELGKYTEEDWRDHWNIRMLRSVNIFDFQKLAAVVDDDFKRQLKNNSFFIVSKRQPSGSYVEYNKQSKSLTFNMVGRYKSKLLTMHSPHICDLAFNSGWFEYEIARMFSDWQYANDIWMNVCFPARNNVTKNEIDIIVAMGHRLLFVECKTHLSKITDVDKFHNAVINFGGTGSIAMFVTDDKLNPEAMEKCAESNVLVFCLRDYRPKLSFNQDEWDYCRRQLYSFLERNMNVINKK